ncbi:MAG TPA: group 1 truncated hemoglobin [Thermoanaerobaculia bacterium]|jgi:hemoglobin
MRRGIRFVAALALVSMLAAVAPLAAQPAAGGQATLYQRLGGYDAIAAVTGDFIGRMAADPELSRFFVGHSTQSLQRIQQLVVEQLCQAAGGPCFYTGRSMKESHAGMGITEAQWDIAVKHLVATLDKFKVGEKERQDLFAAIAPLKADIVDSKKP